MTEGDPGATEPTLAPHGPLWQRLAAPVASNPRSRAGWQERRRAIRDAVRVRLGMTIAPERLPLTPRSTPVAAAPGVVLERVAFQVWPGVEVAGWLARPEGGEPLPALLAIGAAPWTPLAGAERDHLLSAARRGFIALALNGLRLDRPALGLSTTGLLVWNHLRAFEYLLARPEADRSRIALIAAGAGSYLAASVIALEERLAAAALAGGAGYFGEALNGDAEAVDFTAPPGILAAADLPEMLAVLAPKPLLIAGGAGRDEEAAIGDLLNLYGLFQLQDRLAHRPEMDEDDDSSFALLEWLAAAMGVGAAEGVSQRAPATTRSNDAASSGIPSRASPALREAYDGLVGDPSRASSALRESGGTLGGEPGHVSSAPHEAGDARGEAPGGTCSALREAPEGTGGDPAEATFARRESGAGLDEAGEPVAQQWSAVVDHYLARAAQPPRLESRAARKNYQARLRAELRELARDPSTEVALLPVAADSAVTLQTEAGAHVLLRFSSGDGERAQVVVILEGVDDDSGVGALAEACRAAGFGVARLASRLALEHSPGWPTLLKLAGRPAAGMAARDLVSAVDYLARRRDVDTRRIAVAGIGPAGIPALLAAAWDERIGAVIADCRGTTYRDGGAGLPLLPGILQIADVPQIASLAAPRPLWLVNVPAERAGFSSRRYYDWTRRTYQSLGAEEALRMDTGVAPRGQDLAEWLARVFRRR